MRILIAVSHILGLIASVLLSICLIIFCIGFLRDLGAAVSKNIWKSKLKSA